MRYDKDMAHGRTERCCRKRADRCEYGYDVCEGTYFPVSHRLRVSTAKRSCENGSGDDGGRDCVVVQHTCYIGYHSIYVLSISRAPEHPNSFSIDTGNTIRITHNPLKYRVMTTSIGQTCRFHGSSLREI